MLTTIQLYTPTNSYHLTLDFKGLKGLYEALEYPQYLAPEGAIKMDSVLKPQALYATSIYNEAVKLYKLPNGDIISLNTSEPLRPYMALTKATADNYHRYNVSFKEAHKC